MATSTRKAQLMIPPKNWKQQTLEMLEKKNWGNPADTSTGLVKRCIELAKIPLERFTASDVRVMIEQNFGLFYLVELAIEFLRADTFVETDYYEGDLLQTVFNINIVFWNDNENAWKTVNAITKTKDDLIKKRNISFGNFDKTIYCNLN